MLLKSMVQFAGRLGFKSVSVHSWADMAPSVLQKVYKNLGCVSFLVQHK